MSREFSRKWNETHWRRMASETIRQLQKMEKLLDEYEPITDVAASKIYDWLDGVNIFDKYTGLYLKNRKEQADALLKWFEGRIADMKAGIT